MIKFERVSEKHYKAFMYDCFLSSIAIHKDKYVIHNRYSKLEVPKRLKKYLKFMIMDSYLKDLKVYELNEYSYNQMEGSLSIKKMMKKLQ
tara:strand:+ start:8888 stop:9157 length:270 start_codon:yes stop_codon:yes gene_type:complete